jgi:predicted HicB family RNase H-like nuclease
VNRKGNDSLVTYKGYAAAFEVDAEAGIIFGRVIGLRDVITFQGETVAEATQAFRDSVDVYLEFCEERRKAPEKPFSGRFLLRMDPTLHRRLSLIAEQREQSINTLVEQALQARYGERTGPGFTVEGADPPKAKAGSGKARAGRKSTG